MTTDLIIFIISLVLGVTGMVLSGTNLQALLDLYTDSLRTNRVLCVIGLIMMMLCFIINLCILPIIK